jgi:hypothetical protein
MEKSLEFSLWMIKSCNLSPFSGSKQLYLPSPQAAQNNLSSYILAFKLWFGDSTALHSPASGMPVIMTETGSTFSHGPYEFICPLLLKGAKSFRSFSLF